LDNAFLRAGLAFLTALVVSLAFGAWLIRFFHRKNVIEDTTQPDHAGLNAIQSQKKNVPTMGGLMILVGIVAATLLWANLRSADVLIGMLVLVVLGGAGFVDDYIKLKHKPSRGLTKTQKLVIQFVLGGLVGYLIIRKIGGLEFGAIVTIPWSRAVWHLGWWYIPWCGFIMAATSNAVNLTDGLDGLAGGLMLIAAICMARLGSWFYEGGRSVLHVSYDFFPYTQAPTLCVAIAGAVLGFLRYNRHPAKIFMGDTGSLALGGLLACAAMVMKAELLLLMVGGVFFIEELTVAMQIASFKLTKKRIFPITPIHHYFQVYLKWPEQKIVTLAWCFGLLFPLAAAFMILVTWAD
jgi:phospho-N-acetylmuramoyl-pentapeptide-transferase